MKRLTIICKTNDNPVTAVSELLGSQRINIESLDFNQLDGQAFLSLTLSDCDAGLALLIAAGYNAIPDEIVLLRGNNRPGELAQIARTLTDAGVQIRSLSLLGVRAESGLVAIATNDNKVVRELFAGQLAN